MQYRRIFAPGGIYFFTIVTYHRRPIFSSPHAVEILRQSFRYTKDRYPFEIIAIVVMPDHIHVLLKLPAGCIDFPIRWRLIKSHFSRQWKKTTSGKDVRSRNAKNELNIWQSRYWEHLIRDEDDLSAHIDYIHYNPVKHGFVSAPGDWGYSSFKRFVDQEYYTTDWGVSDNIWAGDPRME
jgi:putative transposase